jgi:hypothetical protein
MTINDIEEYRLNKNDFVYDKLLTDRALWELVKHHHYRNQDIEEQYEPSSQYQRDIAHRLYQALEDGKINYSTNYEEALNSVRIRRADTPRYLMIDIFDINEVLDV